MATATPTLSAPPARAATVPTSAVVRRHRGDVARWALARGHVLRRDALAALLGARVDVTSPTIPLVWTAEDVATVLWNGAASWCRSNGVPVPDELEPTLATYLRYLSTNRLFAAGSDDMATLRRALAEHRRPDARGRAVHPTSRGRAPVLPIS